MSNRERSRWTRLLPLVMAVLVASFEGAAAEYADGHCPHHDPRGAAAPAHEDAALHGHARHGSQARPAAPHREGPCTCLGTCQPAPGATALPVPTRAVPDLDDTAPRPRVGDASRHHRDGRAGCVHVLANPPPDGPDPLA